MLTGGEPEYKKHPGARMLHQATRATRPPLVSSIFGDLGACFRNRNVDLSSLMAGVSFGSMLAMGVLWEPASWKPAAPGHRSSPF